jgi:predicted amidohydrolase
MTGAPFRLTRQLAMSLNDAVDLLASAARRHGVAILTGYAERDGQRCFNAALVVSSSGDCLANYRKMHLWGSYESELFLPGTPGQVFALTPELNAGLLICFDLDHPVTAQDLAARGADILLVVSATTDDYRIVPMAQVPARAYENSVFLAFCNQAGREHGLAFAGLSTVAAPDGRVLARGAPDAADMVFADIEPAAFADYRKAHRYADQLRRDLYPAPGLLKGHP